MKFISWNVNGIRACVKKGFLDYFHEQDADFFCLQETKLQEGQIDLDLEGYQQYWNYAEKKGYSGTAIFAKKAPLSVTYGLGEEIEDLEGRVITLEYEDFYLITMYTPNAKRDLTRLGYRMLWEEAARTYIKQLEETKPVILCGDLNVAHQPTDVKNDRANIGNAGFTDEERGKFNRLLEAGYLDSFRLFYPERDDAFTWWSYMAKVRERNIGWRIDYFLVSKQLEGHVKDAAIDAHIYGSDHCPVKLELKIS
ncbi:exodeoxyribonuclease III [Alkalicoccobacillus porphyridii]|uniref:Exodeoxyribonuclease III n=1 Tax=Alkalicoccobacillus porphyridii TaxID=2597270 RepID=A0A554A055_9BACI|nr:exodeoxyribonuclease III [Alkalicoccobacillus porphyridii]TSB47072.1 exodeoxyribonuclease III [Alkalicoccobacillus porphyridii]